VENIKIEAGVTFVKSIIIKNKKDLKES